jgi:outer membrane lipoprotein
MLLCGCAHVMSEENLKRVDRTIPYAELNASPEAFTGRTVLLGGIIAGVRSSGDVLMLEVARLELFNNEVPNENLPSGGRFLAISSELIDPVIYRPGKLVTIIGEVKGKRIEKIDGVDYPYPLISAREMRLFRASVPAFDNVNPYQNRFGDDKFLGRPPGLADGEPRRPY